MHSVSILVDGSFFLKRYHAVYAGAKDHTSKQIVENLYTMCMKHVQNGHLHRIIYYDCHPLKKKAHNPIDGKAIDFSKSALYQQRVEIFEELRKKRKVALRLGEIQTHNQWLIKPEKTKELLKKSIDVSQLSANDVVFQMKQKGVDIKIGLDIATIAYKKLSNQIVLISADSDFVSASKLARREGLDVILDPMWNHVSATLREHIDGLKSYCPNPMFRKS